MNPNRPESIECAHLEWQNGTPVSTRFEDVYFSRGDGEAETGYVFLGQNHLPERWQQWQQPGSFTIAETGFGTGLNFFCACALWQQMASPGQHLHFISVERYPLQLDDMAKACALRPAFAGFSDLLLRQYPPLLKGIHRLHLLPHNITLTLIFADAIEGLSLIEGVVDAWFLDGFAPARNPAMWQPELFAQMARLSHAETTFATFTAAGTVKRGLQDAGFTVTKHSGYGRKRDMLKGVYSGAAPVTEWTPAEKPWFRFLPCKQPPGKVAIIGAGLAGCCAANALARRGWQVTVLEREAQIASGASGNNTGITYARLTLHDTPQNRWYLGAYLYACRFIRAWMEQEKIPEGIGWQLNGVIQLAFDEDERKAHQNLQASGLWPESMVQFLKAEQISSLLGFSVTQDGLLLRDGGWLNPARFCHQLLRHPGIVLRTGFALEGLQHTNGKWLLQNLDAAFDAVVLANTFDAAQFSVAEHLPLRPVRGQLTHLPATDESCRLAHSVNYAGYISPAHEGFHCAGATFSPWNRDVTARVEDHQQNLDNLRNALPSFFDALKPASADTLQGRVGFRCQTPDYQPIIGPLPDAAAFQSVYEKAMTGKNHQALPACPLQPGLFITTAFGAKGITSAPLAAEILAAYLCGEPQPVDTEVLAALHPARFLFRQLKRKPANAPKP